MGNATARRSRRRSAGEGSVYRNGNRWRGALTWTNPDGTRERRVVSGATAAEARERLDELRAQSRRGQLAPSPRATVAEYLTDWIERERPPRVAPSTWRGRESHVRVYLIPALGRVPLAKLSAEDVDRALTDFQANGRPIYGKSKRGRKVKPISAQTARHIRATLRHALNDAIRYGRVTRNAASEAEAPAVERGGVTYLDAELARRLLCKTEEEPYGPLYAVALATGLRLGELLGLAWQDVDTADRTLRVRVALRRAAGGGWELAQPKSKRSARTIRLSQLAIAALDRQERRQDDDRLAAGDAWQASGLVFADAVGRPLDPHNVSAQFQRDRKAAGVPPIPFHSLRHTAATLMLAQGVPLTTISKMLGHSGIAITDAHYAAVVPELHDHAADAMDRALGAGGAS